MIENINWVGATQIHAKDYVCGYCNRHVGPNTGYQSRDDYRYVIYICSYCNQPTYFYFNSDIEEEFQIPSPVYGEDVKNLPNKVKSLYNEARQCMAVSAYTSAVMLCRILLMHIAVEKGASEENMSFKAYIDWLEKSGYIPPHGKDLLEYIRKKGNYANHEIRLMRRDDAVKLIAFIGLFMKFVYELPSIVSEQEDEKTASVIL